MDPIETNEHARIADVVVFEVIDVGFGSDQLVAIAKRNANGQRPRLGGSVRRYDREHLAAAFERGRAERGAELDVRQT